jgi:hypothetical protein
MKRIVLLLMSILFLFSIPAFCGFRVGDAWQDIPFFQGQFRIAGQGDGWNVTQAPPLFQYKDVGDTVFVVIRMQPEPVSDYASALVITFPESMPVPVNNFQTGICAIYLGANWDRSYAMYEVYSTGVVIWPITGMYAENKFPITSIGVSVEFTYRY